MSGVNPAHERLIEALHPWREHIVWVGGVAHQLHRLHDLATPPAYEPIRTRDADLVFNDRARLAGNIGMALKEAGFVQEFMGTDQPPVYGSGGPGGKGAGLVSAQCNATPAPRRHRGTTIRRV